MTGRLPTLMFVEIHQELRGLTRLDMQHTGAFLERPMRLEVGTPPPPTPSLLPP